MIYLLTNHRWYQPSCDGFVHIHRARYSSSRGMGWWSFYCTCQHLVELLISAWALSSENAFKPPKIPLYYLYKSDKEIKMTNLIHVNLPPTVCFCTEVWMFGYKTAECDFCGKFLRNWNFSLENHHQRDVQKMANGQTWWVKDGQNSQKITLESG